MSDTLNDSLAPDVKLAAGGCVEAFARLVDSTRNMVCSITYSIAQNVEDSEEVAQEVYLAAWQTLPKLRSHASFLPWLRQTARNRARHCARTMGRETRRRVPDAEVLDRAVDPRPDAAMALAEAEERVALTAAMAALPDEVREIVTLYYWEGQSVRAVAELLGLSEDAVKKRLQRAREGLRAELLDSAGKALRRAAPTSALTTAVLAALAVGSPGAASAATLGTGLAASSGALAKVAAVAGGVLGGIISGGGAFYFTMRQSQRRVRSERDRRRLTHYGIAGIALVVVAGVVLPVGYRWTHRSAVFIVLWYLSFIGGVLWMTLGWHKDIMRATVEAERLEDPAGTAARERRERRMAILGATTGIVLGGLPVVAAIWRDWNY